MLWWTWILLWTVLVLGSLAFLAWCAWRLITRHALPAMREAEDAADEFTQRWEIAAQGSTRTLREPAPAAVLTPVGHARAAYARGREQRQTARLIRRIQRKDAAGQPQRLTDVRRAERKGLRHGPLI